MAFNFIRFCHRPLNFLHNEHFTLENIVACQKIISRHSCHAVLLNNRYNNFSKTGFKETDNQCSKLLYDNRHYQSNSITGCVVARSSSCPLRLFFPMSLQGDPKLLVKVYSTSAGASDENSSSSQLSNKDKLKRAVKEYGTTVVVFHVSISLISLGCCYLAVSSGLNIGDFVNVNGLNGSNEVAAEAGLFVVAYAVHKVLAPVRIAITLAATPVIVRYLRKINVLKPPKPS